MSEVNYEEIAAKDGWAPKENWKGDPDKWKTAEEFVNFGKNITPKHELRETVEALSQRVDSLLKSNQALNEMSQRQIKKEQADKQKLIKELESVRKKAVTEGDGDTFAEADEQLAELRKEATPQTPELDPLTQTWLTENSWYGQNRKLSRYADGLADELRAQGYTGQAYFNELNRQVKETFPDEFENPNRKRSNGVETGSEAVVDSKDRTFDNLPTEAKKAYAQFAKDIPGFKKEDYVAAYEWE